MGYEVSDYNYPYSSAPQGGAVRNLPLGTADWQRFARSSASFGVRDFFLTCDHRYQAMGYNDDRHVLVVAGNRAGKGASVLIPNLIAWRGSVFVLDTKGENATVTARRRSTGSRYSRGMGQKTYLFDPFRAAGTREDPLDDLRASFNPVDSLSVSRPESVDDAARLADALIVSESRNEPFWEESARMFAKAVLLQIASSPNLTDEQRNLLTLRRFLLAGDRQLKQLAEAGGVDGVSGFAMLFESMKRNNAWGGVVAELGEWFSELYENSPKLFGSIIQVALTNTDFLDSVELRSVLTKSTFQLHELKSDPKGVSLYLCLPQRYANVHFRLLRMMTTLMVTEMERVKGQPRSGQQVLAVLDEFAALRRMPVIENAAAQIAGQGVKLMMVVQTLAQLKEVYRDNWETMVANAGLKLFFGNDDQFTREYASKLVGECEVIRTTHSESHTTGWSNSSSHGSSSNWNDSSGTSYSSTSGMSGGNFSSSSTTSHSFGRSRGGGYNASETTGRSGSTTRGTSESVHKRFLITPDEVGRYFGDRTKPGMLVLASGSQPVALPRINYFSHPAFRGYFDPHPDHALVSPLHEGQMPQEDFAGGLVRKASAQRQVEDEVRERQQLEAWNARQREAFWDAVQNLLDNAGTYFMRGVIGLTAALSVLFVIMILPYFWG